MSKFDKALERLRNGLKLPESKIEGTFSMFNLRSVAKESALLENKMEIMENNWSIDTARGKYLDAIAKDKGIWRHLASYAYGSVTFDGLDNVLIPAGTIVTAADYGVTFETMQDATINNGGATVEIQCIQRGSIGNVPAHSINHVKLQGVKSVDNPTQIEHGVDREEDANLRQRIYFRIQNPRTSGNKNDYKAWALDNEEVGKAKVFPKWQGAGTVKVSIVTANGTIASTKLIKEVQDYIDPDSSGMGEGKAPIGPVVTVTTATEKPVTITADVAIGDNTSLEAVKEAFEAAIKERFKEIAYDEVTKTVSPARIGYILMEVQGVIDYTNLKLNGDIKAITIADEEIVTLSTVTLS